VARPRAVQAAYEAIRGDYRPGRSRAPIGRSWTATEPGRRFAADTKKYTAARFRAAFDQCVGFFGTLLVFAPELNASTMRSSKATQAGAGIPHLRPGIEDLRKAAVYVYRWRIRRAVFHEKSSQTRRMRLEIGLFDQNHFPGLSFKGSGARAWRSRPRCDDLLQGGSRRDGKGARRPAGGRWRTGPSSESERNLRTDTT